MIKLYIYYYPIDTIILPGPIIAVVVVISNNHQVIVNFVSQDLFTCDEHRRTIVKLYFHKLLLSQMNNS